MSFSFFPASVPQSHNELFNLAEEPILPGYAFGHALKGGEPSKANTELKQYSSLFSLTSEFRERNQIDDDELQNAQSSLHEAHQAWLAVMSPEDVILVDLDVYVSFEELVTGLGMTYSKEEFGKPMKRWTEKNGGQMTMLSFIDWYVRHLYFALDEYDEEEET